MSLALDVKELARGLRRRQSCSTESRSTVPAGGTLSVLGRNGVGKTTLLATLMGLTTRHQGSIHLGNQAIEAPADARAQRLGLGYVPQEREIFPSLTVEENMAVSMRERRLDDRRGVRSISRSQGATQEHGQPALRRRTADACDRPRARRRAEGAAARRATRRPRADRRSRRSSRRSSAYRRSHG